MLSQTLHTKFVNTTMFAGQSQLERPPVLYTDEIRRPLLLEQGDPMIEQLKERVNTDDRLVRRGRFLSTHFLIEVGSTQWLINVVEGRVSSVAQGPFVMASWSFALRAPQEVWAQFWEADPRPGSHDLMALIKRRVLTTEGNLQVFMAHLRYFKECLAKLRVAA